MTLTRTRVRFFGVLGVRQVMAAALGMVVVLTVLPAVLVGGDPLYRRGGTPLLDVPSPSTGQSETVENRDRARPVRLLQKDGSVAELTMEDYLWGVVAAEMPAAFEPEALKAQACAARTYTVICQNASAEKHPQADICGDSTCCQAYTEREAAELRWGMNAQSYTEKITQAVAQTDGLGILYRGQPIQALFFSSAPGKTVDAVAVWGNAVDYLKSVDSPEGEEVPNYHSRAILTDREVRALVGERYPSADLSGDPAGWFGTAARTEGGTVTSIPLGGVTLTGGQVRSLFSLRSAAFTVAWDGASFVFDVIGYGHGVGMSQYGANAMAKQGKTFRDILTWYYTDTAVENLW